MSFFLASSDDCSIDNYFSGMAFSDEAMVLSLPGLLDYLKEGKRINDLVDGRYSLCVNLGEERIFVTDGVGQDCWYYYSDPNFWVVSNSLYAAAKKLKDRKGKLLFNEAAALFYNINHSLGDQPCNENTMVSGVKILPRDFYIKTRGGALSVYKKDSPKRIESEDEYKERLVEYIGVWKSRLRALFSLLENGRIRCDVSGGVDSRIVMGLTAPEEEDYGIKYSSNKTWKEDYLIASLLAKRFDFDINNSEISFPRTVSSDEAIELYKFGNAGVYKNVYWPKHLKRFPSVHLHGAGGENIRGLGSGSAWKVVHRLKSHFRNIDDFEVFKQEYLSWFDRNDIDYNSENSTVFHYRNFRGRFHFGRNWFRSLTNPLVTPLASSNLEAMSDYMARMSRDPKSVQFDILYLCDNVFPFFPFDEKEKFFGIDVVEKSFSYITHLSKNSLREISVFGSFENWKFEDVSGVDDKVINDQAVSEVEDFLFNFESVNSSLSPILLDPAKKLKAFGLISILKLF